MLSSLKIKDILLIEEAELELDGGLTVITGETGAGKSILLGSPELALGDRAESGLVLETPDRTAALVSEALVASVDSTISFYERLSE